MGNPAENLETLEDEYGTTNDQDPSNTANEFVEPETTVQDETGKVPGDDGKIQPNLEEGESDPRDIKIDELTNTVKELQEKVNKVPKTEPTVAQPRVYTDAEKAEIETRFGGIPFQGIQAFNELIGGAVSQVVNTLRTEIHSELGRFKKDAAIESLSQDPEFADIKSFKKGMDEYLKRFNPLYHGNEEVLKDAYWNARGRNTKNMVTKAVNSTEKNRRIATTSRPNSPTHRETTKVDLRLTPLEESAFQTFGGRLTREQYAAGLSRNQKKR